MPPIGNNQAGENGTRSFGGFGPETPYGAVKRLKQAIPGQPDPRTPARRAQRRAARGQQPEQPQAAAPPAVAQQEPSIGQVWQTLAADPEASPLVKEYAASAQTTA